MSKEELIAITIAALQKLPADKVAEVSDFADFISQKNDARQITVGIGKMSVQSKSYKFPDEEEDLYTLHDVKAPDNGKS